jgi:hypothetical protein
MLIKIKIDEDTTTGTGPAIYCTNARAGEGSCMARDVRLRAHAQLDPSWVDTFAALLTGRLVNVRGLQATDLSFARCGECGSALGYELAPPVESAAAIDDDADDQVPAEQRLELGARSPAAGGGVLVRQWIRPRGQSVLHMLERGENATAAGRAIVESGLEVGLEALDERAVAITISDSSEDLAVRICTRETVLEQLDDALLQFDLAAYVTAAASGRSWGEQPDADPQLEAEIAATTTATAATIGQVS